MSDLTPKQERFAIEYLLDMNATQAAIRAGYATRSAEMQGCRLLKNDKVRAEIDKVRTQHAAEIGVTVQTVLDGLHKEATREGEGATHGARVSAWGKLGEHLGMFKQVHEHSGPGGGPLAITREIIDPNEPTNSDAESV